MVVGSTQDEHRKRLDTICSIHNHALRWMEEKYRQRTELKVSQEKLDRRIDREITTSATTTLIPLAFWRFATSLRNERERRQEGTDRTRTGHFAF